MTFGGYHCTLCEGKPFSRWKLTGLIVWAFDLIKNEVIDPPRKIDTEHFFYACIVHHGSFLPIVGRELSMPAGGRAEYIFLGYCNDPDIIPWEPEDA